MKLIIRNGVELKPQIVHGVVVKDSLNLGNIVFCPMNGLTTQSRNYINCGTINPRKGIKDSDNYLLSIGEHDTILSIYRKYPVENQYRRSTLAYAIDESNPELKVVYAALTVFNPLDQGKHNLTKKEGRETASKLLSDLIKNYNRGSVSYGDVDRREISIDDYSDCKWVFVDHERVCCMFVCKRFIYYIVVPDCGFIPKVKTAVIIQQWVEKMIERQLLNK